MKGGKSITTPSSSNLPTCSHFGESDKKEFIWWVQVVFLLKSLFSFATLNIFRRCLSSLRYQTFYSTVNKKKVADCVVPSTLWARLHNYSKSINKERYISLLAPAISAMRPRRYERFRTQPSDAMMRIWSTHSLCELYKYGYTTPLESWAWKPFHQVITLDSKHNFCGLCFFWLLTSPLEVLIHSSHRKDTLLSTSRCIKVIGSTFAVDYKIFCSVFIIQLSNNPLLLW